MITFERFIAVRLRKLFWVRIVYVRTGDTGQQRVAGFDLFDMASREEGEIEGS